MAVLDEIAGEWPRAVQAGRITNPTRVRIIHEQLHDAARYAQHLEPEERERIAVLDRQVAALAPAPVVIALATRLRHDLLLARRLVLAPPGALERERARLQWTMQCEACHGATGFGDGLQGLAMDPSPKDFHQWQNMAHMSPARAFSGISDGVRGTAMPAWGLFTTSERWSLAHLIVGFRFSDEDIARGRHVLAGRPIPVSSLADRTDASIVELLESEGLNHADALAALAYLRAAAPFEPAVGPLAAARTALWSAERHRDRTAVRVALETARSQLEPLRLRLRASDRAIGRRLDRELFLALQAGGGLDEDRHRHLAAIGVLIDTAESALLSPRIESMLMFAGEILLAPFLALGVAISWTRRRSRRLFWSCVALAAVGGVLGGWAASVVAPLPSLILAGAMLGGVLLGRRSVGPFVLAAALGLASGALIASAAPAAWHAGAYVAMAALAVAVGARGLPAWLAATAVALAIGGMAARGTSVVELGSPRFDIFGGWTSPAGALITLVAATIGWLGVYAACRPRDP
ncbi:MAG: c-type cytochrome [Kofleriaceae bacterium]